MSVVMTIFNWICLEFFLGLMKEQFHESDARTREIVRQTFFFFYCFDNGECWS